MKCRKVPVVNLDDLLKQPNSAFLIIGFEEFFSEIGDEETDEQGVNIRNQALDNIEKAVQVAQQHNKLVYVDIDTDLDEKEFKEITSKLNSHNILAQMISNQRDMLNEKPSANPLICKNFQDFMDKSEEMKLTCCVMGGMYHDGCCWESAISIGENVIANTVGFLNPYFRTYDTRCNKNNYRFKEVCIIEALTNLAVEKYEDELRLDSYVLFFPEQQGEYVKYDSLNALENPFVAIKLPIDDPEKIQALYQNINEQALDMRQPLFFSNKTKEDFLVPACNEHRYYKNTSF